MTDFLARELLSRRFGARVIAVDQMVSTDEFRVHVKWPIAIHRDHDPGDGDSVPERRVFTLAVVLDARDLIEY